MKPPFDVEDSQSLEFLKFSIFLNFIVSENWSIQNLKFPKFSKSRIFEVADFQNFGLPKMEFSKIWNFRYLTVSVFRIPRFYSFWGLKSPTCEISKWKTLKIWNFWNLKFLIFWILKFCRTFNSWGSQITKSLEFPKFKARKIKDSEFPKFAIHKIYNSPNWKYHWYSKYTNKMNSTVELV